MDIGENGYRLNSFPETLNEARLRFLGISYHVVSKYSIELQIVEGGHPVERIDLVRLKLAVDHTLGLLSEFDKADLGRLLVFHALVITVTIDTLLMLLL